MIVFQTIAVAFGMFSALPLPQPAWTPRNMRYALCAFPLVGLVCGLCWWGWTALAEFLAMPDLLRGAGLCLVPVLVTGASTWTDTPTPVMPWPVVPPKSGSRRFWRTPTVGPLQ